MARTSKPMAACRAAVCLLSTALLLPACTDTKERTAPSTSTSSDSKGAPAGCVAILRMPTQDVPLIDVFNMLPPNRLLSTPLGSQYDIAYFNGTSPYIQINREPLSKEAVDADLQRINQWVSSNPKYGASLELSPPESSCDPLASRASSGGPGG